MGEGNTSLNGQCTVADNEQQAINTWLFCSQWGSSRGALEGWRVLFSEFHGTPIFALWHISVPQSLG